MKEKINNYIVNTIYFSFVLLTLALISGPLLSDFLISLSAVYLLLLVLLTKNINILKIGFFIFLFFFIFGV